PALAQCRSEILLSEIGQKQAAPRTRETAWETSSRDPSAACDNSVSCRGLLALRFGFPSVVPDTPLAGFADQPVSGLFPVAVNFRKALVVGRTLSGQAVHLVLSYTASMCTTRQPAAPQQ